VFFKRPCLAEAFGRWPLKMKARVRSLASPYDIYGGQSVSGIGLSTNTSVLGCSYHLSNAARTRCSWQKDKRTKPGKLPNSNALSEIKDHLIEKYFRLKKTST